MLMFLKKWANRLPGCCMILGPTARPFIVLGGEFARSVRRRWEPQASVAQREIHAEGLPREGGVGMNSSPAVPGSSPFDSPRALACPKDSQVLQCRLICTYGVNGEPPIV